jgi:hypothetical protein
VLVAPDDEVEEAREVALAHVVLGARAVRDPVLVED